MCNHVGMTQWVSKSKIGVCAFSKINEKALFPAFLSVVGRKKTRKQVRNDACPTKLPLSLYFHGSFHADTIAQ